MDTHRRLQTGYEQRTKRKIRRNQKQIKNNDQLQGNAFKKDKMGRLEHLIWVIHGYAYPNPNIPSLLTMQACAALPCKAKAIRIRKSILLPTEMLDAYNNCFIFTHL